MIYSTSHDNDTLKINIKKILKEKYDVLYQYIIDESSIIYHSESDEKHIVELFDFYLLFYVLKLEKRNVSYPLPSENFKERLIETLMFLSEASPEEIEAKHRLYIL